jgi:hypothetical protein
VETKEGAKLYQSREKEFKSKIQNASQALVGVGGALHGMSRLDWELTKKENQSHKFERKRTEALFTKIKQASRRDQNYGANEAKFEVISFILDSAREKFRLSTAGAISGIVEQREKRRAEAIQAKKEGKVAQSEIDEMRGMLKNGDITDKQKITLYMVEFKMGIKGQKPPRREFPFFLMLKFIPDDLMAEFIRSANRRGRNDNQAGKRAGSYFRRSSLAQFLTGFSQAGETQEGGTTLVEDKSTPSVLPSL